MLHGSSTKDCNHTSAFIRAANPAPSPRKRRTTKQDKRAHHNSDPPPPHQRHVAHDGLQEGGLAGTHAPHHSNQLPGPHTELRDIQAEGAVAKHVLEGRLGVGCKGGKE
jgi:hypothetical protein